MESVAVIVGLVSFSYFMVYKYNMETKELSPAEKHYLAMKKAQKKYYEKKMNEKGPRRGRGRPKKEKVVDEVKEDSVDSV